MLLGWIDILVHRSSMDITLPWRSQRALPLVPACQTHVQLPGGTLKWQKVETPLAFCHSMTCWRFCDGLISGAPRVATLATLTALGCYRDLPFCFSQYFVSCHDLIYGSMVFFASQYPYHPHASRMVPSGKFPSSSRKRESVTLRAIQYRSLTVMRISRSVEPRAYSSFRFIFSGCCICIYTQGWF